MKNLIPSNINPLIAEKIGYAFLKVASDKGNALSDRLKDATAPEDIRDLKHKQVLLTNLIMSVFEEAFK
jgi:hypothetical protein